MARHSEIIFRSNLTHRMPNHTHPNPQFPDTRWTLVLQTRDADNPNTREKALPSHTPPFIPTLLL